VFGSSPEVSRLANTDTMADQFIDAHVTFLLRAILPPAPVKPTRARQRQAPA
jgi:hypothetical protein